MIIYADRLYISILPCSKIMLRFIYTDPQDWRTGIDEINYLAAHQSLDTTTEAFVDI